MRKRRWLIILGSLAALFVLLCFANKWMIATGHSLTLYMGANIERPEFVQVNWPFNVDVVHHVTDSLESNGGTRHLWTVHRDFTLRNDYDKEIRVHLPLLRASVWMPRSTEYLFTSQLDPEWKVRKTITLKPGESFKISFPESMYDTANEVYNGQESKECGRWALVFGVPDGEDPDKYLVGTVWSNPIQWRNEIPAKSKK